MSPKRGWRIYFPKHEVPAAVERLVKSGILRDRSWQHDLMPNFDAVLQDGAVVTLFVDHPDKDRRMMYEGKRFEIRLYEPGVSPVTLFETNDIGEALFFLRTIIQNRGGPRMSS